MLVGATIGAASLADSSDALAREIADYYGGNLPTVGAHFDRVFTQRLGLIVFRIIVGFGIGMASVTLPIYITEMSPAAKRGGLVTLNSLP